MWDWVYMGGCACVGEYTEVWGQCLPSINLYIIVIVSVWDRVCHWTCDSPPLWLDHWPLSPMVHLSLCLAFPWKLRIWTQVPMLAQKELFPPSHLPNPYDQVLVNHYKPADPKLLRGSEASVTFSFLNLKQCACAKGYFSNTIEYRGVTSGHVCFTWKSMHL